MDVKIVLVSHCNIGKIKKIVNPNLLRPLYNNNIHAFHEYFIIINVIVMLFWQRQIILANIIKFLAS